ncbi:O-linked-mannose beta-1,4-N-acetylglucosaminyltransferase-like protein [Parasponia andersonii]|uniref:O-linked-mannose beta-1,4-N-acetylglucosaminyltransferase-like protein n=1 Tax=Parasponia andersonii TaxID=3476 RepID=A0A2P5E254_PARAD|nr:O-linked-mannose beta-1,4-N-acetylglucosaminyltransferase-like protein [Parasponia andersonii]
MKKRDPGRMVILMISLALLVTFYIIFQINVYPNLSLSLDDTQYTTKPTPQGLAIRAIRRRDPHHTRPIVCDRAHDFYDICKINGPTVLDPTTSTFFVMDPNGPNLEERIRPYTRKWEKSIMSRIKELTLVSGPKGPPCEVQHEAPALVFSAGGYTGNFFHDFNDVFIPLYITVYSLFNDQKDLVLVISKSRDWWVNKYSDLLRSFSKHPIINLDNDTATHCFPSARLGLVTHGFMTINPKLVPKSLTLTHFRAFLEKSYGAVSNRRRTGSNRSKATRPRLVLVSRAGGDGRVLLNQNKVKRVAEKVGFDVVSFEPSAKTALSSASELINSSHAMVGVHGAALTHSLFLRPGSVFIQVVPLGVEWLAEVCFGKPARDLGLEYAEYRISVQESSLLEKYGKEDMIVKDPVAFRGKSWSNEIMNVYLKEQDIRVDLVRFRRYLKEAYKKIKRFMDH